MTRDWRNAEDYTYTAHLNRAQWAWEFLRRHPGYRADWQWFWQTWRALEADYGVPPQRDFARWKRDPRAFRQESDTAGGCVADDDKVLIECWMGAKWGFYKFPREAESLGEELAWRDVPLRLRVLNDAQIQKLGAEDVALAFNLARPLKEQLEQARMTLVALQQRFKRGGGALETVATMTPQWTLALRVLDAEMGDAPPTQMEAAVGLSDAALTDVLALAYRLRDGDYRHILRLPDK